MKGRIKIGKHVIIASAQADKGIRDWIYLGCCSSIKCHIVEIYLYSVCTYLETSVKEEV